MDNIKQWIVERKIIYFIFALLYDGKIDQALDIIKKNELLQNFSDYTNNKQLSGGSNQVIKELHENQNDNHYKDLILEEYQRLFIGPDEILAPLWESVYKTKDKLLFGEIELENRRYYNSNGLDVKESEPADYLPMQLSFISRLCDAALEDNFENINENLAKQRDFLKDHLISWIPYWVEGINQNAETQFWLGFVQMTTGWLENDFDEIEKVIEIMANL
ncbi:molecular chaperone TorD family protein [Clostridium sp. YIM B02555]|uniref:TorD/DmsD family molecular chaperone n=1 Tax=Clostridium sp. YIM B02555 TaxID=2911968 RepID=UPI001EEF4813|nr:molecular chaperone TorD family protein [Clostridium sp. YIM B02555]